MSTSPQARMAHDIARQFRHLAEDQTVKAIAEHIAAFWDPRMRAELIFLAHHDPSALDGCVVAAARALDARSQTEA